MPTSPNSIPPSAKYLSLSIQANTIINKYKEAADKANKNDELEKEIKKIQDSLEK